MTIRNHYLKISISFPSLIFYLSINCSSCNDSPKLFLPISFNDSWVKNNIPNIGENEIQLHNYNQLQPLHSKLAKLDIFPLYNYPMRFGRISQMSRSRLCEKLLNSTKKPFFKNSKWPISCCHLQQAAMPAAWTSIISPGELSSSSTFFLQ